MFICVRRRGFLGSNRWVDLHLLRDCVQVAPGWEDKVTVPPGSASSDTRSDSETASIVTVTTAGPRSPTLSILEEDTMRPAMQAVLPTEGAGGCGEGMPVQGNHAAGGLVRRV